MDGIDMAVRKQPGVEIGGLFGLASNQRQRVMLDMVLLLKAVVSGGLMGSLVADREERAGAAVTQP
jgi:hypothetical protein